MVSEPHVRLLGNDDYTEAARLVGGTMLGNTTDEVSRAWAEVFQGGTTHGAMSAVGELAGVARWFSAELSLAGESVSAAAVTAVAVLPTHRRQGHLRRLMGTQLDSVAEADLPVGLLVAAEWGIYGRYGYGPAIDACGYEIDTGTARFTTPPTGSVELVSLGDLRPHLEAVHDLRWARTMGAITRDCRTWDWIAGTADVPGRKRDAGLLRGAIWRNDSGAVLGAVAYSVEDHWTHNRPTGTISVELLVGATPEAERELWRHLVHTDWIATVKAGNRSIDDPLPLWLDDGRAAVQVDRFDCIWARLMDVPRVLGARRSMTAGTAVIEVVDDLGYAGGRFSLDLSPEGAHVATTTASADVRLSIGALGAVSLGGGSLTRLHEAGWVDEESAGGVRRVDALLRAPTAPWSPTTY